MKNYIYFAAIIIFIILLLILASSFFKTAIGEINPKKISGAAAVHGKEYAVNIKSMDENVPEKVKEKIIDILIERFGKTDPGNGFGYIFEIAGTVKFEGKDYFIGRWRWLVEDKNGYVTHSSLITEFIINSELTEMYSGRLSDSGMFHWSAEGENLLL